MLTDTPAKMTDSKSRANCQKIFHAKVNKNSRQNGMPKGIKNKTFFF